MIVGPTKPPSGGISTVLNDMMASSLRNKIEMVLLDNSKRTPKDRTLWQGIKSQLGIIREFIAMIRKEKPDIVHIHSGGTLDFYRKSIDVLLAKLLGTKVVFHNKGGDFNHFVENRTFIGRAYVRFVLNRCNKVMVLSQSWKEFHSKLISPDRISVLYNGVNSAPYERKMHYIKARHILDIPKNRAVFLLMGVKGKRKGCYDIVEAATLVKRMDPSALFVLVGPDEDVARGATQELEQLRKERDVEELVDMRPEANEKERFLYYAAADCFLLPSYAENSPVSIIEAMAAKLPVIATNIAAVPELIDHEKTGLLIEPGRPSEIAEAVVKLSKDLPLRKEMGRAGFKKFHRQFDMEHAFVRTIWEIYKEVGQGPEQEEPQEKDEKDEHSESPSDAQPPSDTEAQAEAEPLSEAERRLEDAADQIDNRDLNTDA